MFGSKQVWKSESRGAGGGIEDVTATRQRRADGKNSESTGGGHEDKENRRPDRHY